MPSEMTREPVRIVAAAHHADLRVHYQTVLPVLGHRLLSTAGTGRELIERCRKHAPDLVIADSKLPDMDIADAAEEVCRTGRVPIIVTADQFDPQQIRHNGADHFWAFLTKPIARGHLEALIPFVVQRFNKMQAFMQEVESLRLQVKSGLCLRRKSGDVNGSWLGIQRLRLRRQGMRRSVP